MALALVLHSQGEAVQICWVVYFYHTFHEFRKPELLKLKISVKCPILSKTRQANPLLHPPFHHWVKKGLIHVFWLILCNVSTVPWLLIHQQGQSEIFFKRMNVLILFSRIYSVRRRHSLRREQLTLPFLAMPTPQCPSLNMLGLKIASHWSKWGALSCLIHWSGGGG